MAIIFSRKKIIIIDHFFNHVFNRYKMLNSLEILLRKLDILIKQTIMFVLILQIVTISYRLILQGNISNIFVFLIFGLLTI